MNLHNIFCWKKKKKVFKRGNYTESDLIQYSVDHLKSAEKLYDFSDRFTWKHLHSAAFLSNLGIELLLKACLLHLKGEFPLVHDLNRLFRQLRKRGIKLSDQNKKWLNDLNEFNALRYPDPEKRTAVNLNQWKKTKALFEELGKNASKEIQVLIQTHSRYPSNVKSGKTIWLEN